MSSEISTTKCRDDDDDEDDYDFTQWSSEHHRKTALWLVVVFDSTLFDDAP